ncbi:Fizzy- protein [Dissostichus eleginoides]|nr:Fizzy- protein [Dissostichus eleginoides]
MSKGSVAYVQITVPPEMPCLVSTLPSPFGRKRQLSLRCGTELLPENDGLSGHLSHRVSERWGSEVDFLTGRERSFKRGAGRGGAEMDQEYERRLLRQINPQNVPTEAGQAKCVSATCSPVSVKSGDRFIPTRAGSNWSINFHYANENCRSPNQNHKAKDASSDSSKDAVAYAALLRNELLGAGIESVPDPHTDDRRQAVLSHDSHSLFRYTVHTKRVPFDSDNEVSPYSLSPLSNKSHKLLRSPRKPARKISKIPFKVLDAPELQDDFYLNLVDWSAGNLLSVGLGSCVYLWSACTSQVTRLCDLSVDGDSVTSVCWNERGSLVAVGTHKGYVQIWDAAGGRKLSSLEGHSARVGALAWNGEQLSSGSRDRVILQRDVRTPPSAERRLQGHRQEVCGLKWSPDHQHLASGGNDNKLLVWNSSSLLPVQQYSDHLAAVKAIAWSPHQHGLLASGGGTADRCLRFWNTLTGQALQSTDTGSQVCNLAWSKHANELVSTHGYSQNQILVWKYPSLTQVAKLTGHSYRVLYLAVSPDGEAIVTGAGDETLRFWNVFSKTRCTKESKSVLNLFTRIR